MSAAPPRIGALFAGYGGLDMAVSEVFGGQMAWYSEIDKGALKILGHRFPDVPNVGDVTTADWSQVEPIDILTGGSPCQDLSHAGKRQGMTEGTRSNLWVAMREAIAQLHPATVVWENVRGAYSAEADSDLESDPRLLADVRRRDGLPVLRALGRVLGDLSDLGYDTSWHGLRAADVGAPHGRFRVFVVARDSSCHNQRDGRITRDGGPWRDQEPTRAADRNVADARSVRRGEGWTAGPGEETGGRPLSDADRRDSGAVDAAEDACLRGSAGRAVDAVPSLRTGDEGGVAAPDRPQQLLPTPRATDGTKGGPNQRGSSGDLMLPSAVALLPTPAAQEPGGTLADYHARLKAHDGRDSKFAPLSMAVQLLPTPSVADVQGGRKSRSGARNDEPLLNGIAAADLWGDYATAIVRWEHILGRPTPAATTTSAKGNPQLSARFVEWLMGLPKGWVTDTPGITRNEALKALGNGVVPQQAAAALRTMLAWEVVA